LQIVALSGIFIGVNSIFGNILRIKKKIKELLIISFIGAIAILGLSYLFLDKGLVGIGLALIIGQGVVVLGYIIMLKVGKK